MKIFYGEVFKALNKARVKYVVVGGAAVILHGYPRATKDLDLIPFNEIYKKRIYVKLGEIKVPLISIYHLKKLKKAAGRPHDLIDLVQLEAIERIQNETKNKI